MMWDRGRWIAGGLALVAWGGAGSAGCRGCGTGDRPLAELTARHGDVTRDTSMAQRTWMAAKTGATFGMGDGLRTGASSDAAIRLASGGTIAVASESTVRFASGPKPRIAIESGEAIVEADTGEVEIQTTIGIAHLEAGGKARVSANGDASHFEVTLGGARVEREDGAIVTVGAGESLGVALGGAVVERAEGISDGGPPIDASRAPDSGEPDASSHDPVTLEVHGAGATIVMRGESAARPLVPGTHAVGAGDAVDVPAGTTIDVRRGSDRGRVLGAGRFTVGEAGSPLLRADAGKIELETSGGDVALEVPGGVLIARGSAGKSRVDANVTAGVTKVLVHQGDAEVRGKAANEAVRAGETASVLAKGMVVVGNRSADRADFTVKAGDSFTIRDPHPPTAVGFDFSSLCPGPAVVAHADGTGARGDRKAVLSLAAGFHDLSVRCIGADGVEDTPAATAAVTVVRDAARAELPTAAPSTVVDTDGRKYTVLYQNLLPSVVARWRDSGAGDAFVLHLDAQTFKVPAPRKELSGGSVTEGSHTLWFETEDRSRRSAETTLVLRFDNAAPTASVREPVDGAFHAGDKVRVAGVVVGGWAVTVNGQAVPLDEQKRFSAEATVPASDDALVLRLAHAKRGTVYYVRHAGAPGGAKP